MFKKIFCKHNYEFNSNIYGEPIHTMFRGNRSIWKCSKCGNYEYRPNLYEAEYINKIIHNPSINSGEISDGYHTFNELYDYRMAYNASMFNQLSKDKKYNVHKSKKHHDGELCFGGGWFIVVANLPTGQISNHYEDKYWDYFQIEEKDNGDEWDGHTPKDVFDRICEFNKKA